ncbi:MAG: spermidine synthase [Thermoplasmata archaeon]|nr:MAG: spermidine synthase [Thermoplasmata archaeon]
MITSSLFTPPSNFYLNIAFVVAMSDRIVEWYDFGYCVGFEVCERIMRLKSKYQEIEIYSTKNFGKILLIDKKIQLVEAFEPMYHEALVHPAMILHPTPRNVLIIGGGDGGAVREVLKHSSVESCLLVEIDNEVIGACKKHLGIDSGALDDPRVRIVCTDGFSYIKGCADENKKYDVIIVDSTDPIGHAASLFSPEFYAACARVAPIIATQSGPALFNAKSLATVVTSVNNAYENTRVYIACVIGYAPPWSFVLGWRGNMNFDVDRLSKIRTHYVDSENVECMFKIPPALRKELPR